MMIGNPIKIVFLAACLFFLSSCATVAKLDYWAGELLTALDQPMETAQVSDDGSTELEGAEKIDYSALTRIQKKAIDEWLDENDLNRYGDAVDTVYAGGTPLVDEASNENINRFEYILKQIPDIMEKID